MSERHKIDSGPETLDDAKAIIRDLVLWINTKSRHLPEKDRARIQDYIKRKGIRGSVFRLAALQTQDQSDKGGMIE